MTTDGNFDWMDPNAGRRAAASMSVPTSVSIISGADHHLYLDNAEEFNREVVEIIRNIQEGAVPKEQ